MNKLALLILIDILRVSNAFLTSIWKLSAWHAFLREYELSKDVSTPVSVTVKADSAHALFACKHPWLEDLAFILKARNGKIKTS